MQNIKNIKTYINKSDIIKILANQYTNLSNKMLKKAVENIFDIMTYTLANGGKIEVRGFGNFSRRFRSTIKARNPKLEKKLNYLQDMLCILSQERN